MTHTQLVRWFGTDFSASLAMCRYYKKSYAYTRGIEHPARRTTGQVSGHRVGRFYMMGAKAELSYYESTAFPYARNIDMPLRNVQNKALIYSYANVTSGVSIRYLLSIGQSGRSIWTLLNPLDFCIDCSAFAITSGSELQI